MHFLRKVFLKLETQHFNTAKTADRGSLITIKLSQIQKMSRNHQLGVENQILWARFRTTLRHSMYPRSLTS